MAAFSTRGLAGIALMVVGTVLFALSINPLRSLNLLIALGAILLTIGTYIVGTDVEGRIV